TKLHKALTYINKARRHISTHKQATNLNKIQNFIQQVNNLSKTQIQIQPSTTIEEIDAILKTAQQQTKTARNIENQTAKNQHIKNCIERRYQNFQNNTSKMIKSILKKHTDPVILHNIRTHDNIITEPDEIKTAIQEHFKNWTKLNPTQTELWQEWANEYKPIQTIDST
ncbi:13781_t:CDS:1, partial [Ambispora leptoticha]